MNPSIQHTSSLFLPLSNLNPLCLQLHNSLSDPNVGQRERSSLEQTLWTKVKDTKKLNNETLLKHFIGFYQKILLIASKRREINESFQYSVLIRLGDLNRYIQQPHVAGYYYCNARNLIPSFGHAYNQLGLLTDPMNIYKRCYFFARAARSSERSLKTIADSNLKMAVNELDCAILNHVLTDQTCLDPSDINRTEEKFINLPQSALQWFHVMVVALYANNVQSIARLFLRHMNDHFSTQRSTFTSSDGGKTSVVYCDRESYLLLASQDLLLDWLRLRNNVEDFISTISQELRKVRYSLQTTLMSMKYDSNCTFNTTSAKDLTTSSTKSADTTNSSLMFCESGSEHVDSSKQDTSTSTLSEKQPRDSSGNLATIHDYVLKGFEPLNCVHKDLIFSVDPLTLIKAKNIDQSMDRTISDQRFIESDQLKSLLLRIRSKTDILLPPIKKRTRNIALQSILSITDA